MTNEKGYRLEEMVALLTSLYDTGLPLGYCFDEPDDFCTIGFYYRSEPYYYWEVRINLKSGAVTQMRMRGHADRKEISKFGRLDHDPETKDGNYMKLYLENTGYYFHQLGPILSLVRFKK